MRKLFTIAIVTSLAALLLGGCAMNAVWDHAGDNQLNLSRIVGVRARPGDAGRQLIMSYTVISNSRGGERFFALPLDGDGLPPRLFVYQGPERSFLAIYDHLSGPEGRPILQGRLTELAAGDSPAPGPALLEFGAAGHSDQLPYNLTPAGFYVGGFRRSAEGMLEPVKAQVVKTGPAEIDLVWPADSVIIILPIKQPRPSGDYARSRAVAGILTPFALAADVALAPFVFVLFLMGGH